jgi:CheY-like chemotaxis protein
MGFRNANFIIVIADNDPDDQSIIKEAFIDLNGNAIVHHVYNGLELLEWLDSCYTNQTIPDLILMDLNMPLLNGFGALSKIKTNSSFSQIPVYVLSTSRFEYDKLKVKELGAEDFFTKPFKYDELKSIIREIYSRLGHLTK